MFNSLGGGNDAGGNNAVGDEAVGNDVVGNGGAYMWAGNILALCCDISSND